MPIDFSQYAHLIVHSNPNKRVPCIYDLHALDELCKRLGGRNNDRRTQLHRMLRFYGHRLLRIDRHTVDLDIETDLVFPWSSERKERFRQQHLMMIAVVESALDDLDKLETEEIHMIDHKKSSM
jgi:hypothetical protein